MGQSAPRGHQHDLKKLSGGFAATLSWTNKNSVHKRHTHTHTRTRARARPAPPPLPWRRRRGWIFLFFFFLSNSKSISANVRQELWQEDGNLQLRFGICVDFIEPPSFPSSLPLTPGLTWFHNYVRAPFGKFIIWASVGEGRKEGRKEKREGRRKGKWRVEGGKRKRKEINLFSRWQIGMSRGWWRRRRQRHIIIIIISFSVPTSNIHIILIRFCLNPFEMDENLVHIRY